MILGFLDYADTFFLSHIRITAMSRTPYCMLGHHVIVGGSTQGPQEQLLSPNG